MYVILDINPCSIDDVSISLSPCLWMLIAYKMLTKVYAIESIELQREHGLDYGYTSTRYFLLRSDPGHLECPATDKGTFKLR